MIRNLVLYIKAVLLFFFIAIPITHIVFFILISLIENDLSLMQGIIKLLPFSFIVGFIPLIITAITAEALRQNSDSEYSYLCFILFTALFIVTPYIFLLFYHDKDILSPILLILSSLISTLLTGHFWWKLQTVK